MIPTIASILKALTISSSGISATLPEIISIGLTLLGISVIGKDVVAETAGAVVETASILKPIVIIVSIVAVVIAIIFGITKIFKRS